MKIEIGKHYLTKTIGMGYYSDWIVQPIELTVKDQFLCLAVVGKDLPNARLELPFWSHELFEISPVLKELYE